MTAAPTRTVDRYASFPALCPTEEKPIPLEAPIVFQ
jgi:hypothetical protein